MEETFLKILWTFESKEKLDAFLPILQNNDIQYQQLAKGKQIASDSGVILSVEEDDYIEAKKLLMFYRRKNTNRNRK
jgi:hypothetical protein